MVAQVDKTYLRRRPTRLWTRLLSYGLFEGRPLTTKGRWWNPVVFFFLKRLSLIPVSEKVDAPGFIVGIGRSGTTILGVVLSMHYQVGFLNEPKAIWSLINKRDDLTGSYNGKDARYRFGSEDAEPEMVSAAHRIYGTYLKLTGNKRVVDKYPEMVFRTPFVREIFPDAKFIFLSRGGAATCNSIIQWSERLGVESRTGKQDWWGTSDLKWELLVDQLVRESKDLSPYMDQIRNLDHGGRAAVEWILTMREGLQLIANDPSDTLHVPYESLCASPREWAVRIQEFLNLDYDTTFVDYAVATLSDSPSTAALRLPGWLEPIFNDTEAAVAELRD